MIQNSFHMFCGWLFLSKACVDHWELKKRRNLEYVCELSPGSHFWTWASLELLTADCKVLSACVHFFHSQHFGWRQTALAFFKLMSICQYYVNLAPAYTRFWDLSWAESIRRNLKLRAGQKDSEKRYRKDSEKRLLIILSVNKVCCRYCCLQAVLHIDC